MEWSRGPEAWSFGLERTGDALISSFRFPGLIYVILLLRETTPRSARPGADPTACLPNKTSVLTGC